MYAYDNEAIELMQRTYNTVLLSVFGDSARPEDTVRDAIALTILSVVASGQRDPIALADQAMSRARSLLTA